MTNEELLAKIALLEAENKALKVASLDCTTLSLPECTRVEVIGNKGRIYTNYDIKCAEVHLQDDARTLKIFIYYFYSQ